MQIEQGKFYRMRSGGKVFVAAVVLPNPFSGKSEVCPVRGYKSTGLLDRWLADGSWNLLGVPTEFDLIEEWREPVTEEVTMYLKRCGNTVWHSEDGTPGSGNIVGSAKVKIVEGVFA